MKRGLIVAGLCAATTCMTDPAWARTIQDERYGVEQTWNATIRLLRVEMGFTIIERDREAGFVLFTYRDTSRTSPGSVEILPVQVDGVPGSRVIVHLAAMPSYAERHLLARLARKLREEYGEPRSPSRRPERSSEAAPPSTPSDARRPPREGNEENVERSQSSSVQTGTDGT